MAAYERTGATRNTPTQQAKFTPPVQHGQHGRHAVQGRPGGPGKLLQFFQHPMRTVKALLHRKVESTPPQQARATASASVQGMNRTPQGSRSSLGGSPYQQPPVATTPPIATTPPVATTPPAVSTPPAVTTPPIVTTPPAATTPPVVTETDFGIPADPAKAASLPGKTDVPPVLHPREKGDKMDREAREQGLAPKPSIDPQRATLNQELLSGKVQLKPMEITGAEGKAEVQTTNAPQGLPAWVQQELAREQGLQTPKPLPKPLPQALAKPFDLGAIPESQWQQGALTAKLQLAEELIMPRPKGLDTLADALGKQLAAQFSHLDPRHEMALPFSSREQLEASVLDTLAEDVPGALPSDPKALTPLQRQALARVVDTMMKNLPTRVLDNDHILLHGKVYERDRSVGKGHFGDVQAFKEVGGTGQVAVKIAQPGKMTKEEMQREARLTYEASQPTKGQPPDSLIKPLALMANDKGELWTVMPLHDKGTGRKIIDAIQVAKSQGRVTPQQAQAMQLTLIQDLLRAQAHLQSQVGIAHNDVRADNTLVSKEGVLVLVDLGLGRDTRDADATAPKVLPIRWTAPEAFSEGDKAPDVRSDSFMGGILANELLTGKLPPDVEANEIWDPKSRNTVVNTGQLIAQRKQMVQQGGQMLPNANLQKNPLPANASPETVQQAQLGVTALAKLISSLMHPDVNQRMNAETALQSGVFDAPGVGTQETRDLILDLLR